MSGFAQIATRAISSRTKTSNKVLDKLDELNNAGFSRGELLRELKELSDSCEEDEKTIKFQILKTAAQMHGMLVPDEQVQSAPTIQLTVVGNDVRVAAMICPKFEVNNE